MAPDFDRVFGENPATVLRFEVIDRVQQRVCAGCSRVLELGCGTGRLLRTLQAQSRHGVDVSKNMLTAARGLGLDVARADAHHLPFRDRTFDGIAAGNAVFRYLDYPRAFSECARVLKPGGRLAVHQYAARTWSPGQWLGLGPEPANDTPLHLHDVDELRRPARACGLYEVEAFFWRGLRFAPYIVSVPEVLAFPILGRVLWDHITLVFGKAA